MPSREMSQMWRTLLCLLAINGIYASPAVRAQCDDTKVKYSLDQSWEGHTFTKGWKFDEAYPDPTNGPTLYVNESVAIEDGLITTGDSWAAVRTGGLTNRTFNTTVVPLRKSVRLMSEKSWSYFLLVMKFEKLPYGCGVWPAFWTVADPYHYEWPMGGEFDLLEYCNLEVRQQSSMHVGKQCKLQADAVAQCGEFPDKNGMDYDCHTNYAQGALGCAPNSNTWAPTGKELSDAGGFIAMELTPRHVKVFYSTEAPADIDSDTPNPNEWRNALVGYYPLAASKTTCPDYTHLFAPQNVILNIAFCGDWANGVWGQDGSCKTKAQTCNDYTLDHASDGDLEKSAFFNVSYIKVYTPQDETET